FDNLRTGTAQDLKLNFAEAFSQFVDVRQDKAELDAGRYCKLERANLSVIYHRGECTRALGAIVALLEQRKHSLAERREHGTRPLAPKKVAAQFALQKFDGTSQRRLGNVTFFCRAGEVQTPRNSQEIPNLVHLHANVPLDGRRITLACLRSKLALRQLTHILHARVQ